MSNVNHPSHYNSGKIEVAEAIEDWKLGFHLGNVVKYVARAGKKDPAKHVEDLEKAEWYLKRMIELLKAEKENRDVVRPNDMNPRHEKDAASMANNIDDNFLTPYEKCVLHGHNWQAVCVGSAREVKCIKCGASRA
jgi:hypothetical protein